MLQMMILSRKLYRYFKKRFNPVDCTGVIFGHMPKDAERMKLIEAMFEEEGIPVVWHDETIEHRKGRS